MCEINNKLRNFGGPPFCPKAVRFKVMDISLDTKRRGTLRKISITSTLKENNPLNSPCQGHFKPLGAESTYDSAKVTA